MENLHRGVHRRTVAHGNRLLLRVGFPSAAAIVLTGAGPLLAADYVFVGTGNPSNWASVSSWQVDGQTPATVPGADDDMVTPTGTGALGIQGSQSIHNVSHNGTSLWNWFGRTSDATATIQGTLVLGEEAGFLLRGSTGNPTLIVNNIDNAPAAVVSAGQGITFGTNTSSGRPAQAVEINNGVLEMNANVTVAAFNAAFNGGVHQSESVATTFTFNFQGFNTSVAFLSGGTATSRTMMSTSQYTAPVDAWTSTLIIDGDDTFAPQTYHGIIQNGNATHITAVNKTGSITQVFSGDSTYTGGTTISAGMLLANSSTGTSTTSSTGSGAVLVQNGGTLGGTGHVSGAVTVESGGSIRGGDGTTGSTLTLSNNADLTIADGGVIRLTLGEAGAHSTLARTGGTWTFDADQAFLFDTAGTVDSGASFDNLITGLETDPGTLASWQILNSGWEGDFSYDGAGGVDLMITAVPEPGVIAPIAAAGLLALRRRRRIRFA